MANILTAIETHSSNAPYTIHEPGNIGVELYQLCFSRNLFYLFIILAWCLERCSILIILLCFDGIATLKMYDDSDISTVLSSPQVIRYGIYVRDIPAKHLSLTRPLDVFLTWCMVGIGA